MARKTEKRKEKAANQAANAANWSVYVCGIPTEVSHTAVQNLFSKARELAGIARPRVPLPPSPPLRASRLSSSPVTPRTRRLPPPLPKAGEVKRVKLYKDGRGENKGDGIVTFASGGAVKAALEPGPRVGL